MKIKKISCILTSVFLISSSYASEDCIKKDFWSTWYSQGSFKGFGLPPIKAEIHKAEYQLAEEYYQGKRVSKNYTKARELFSSAADGGLDQANFRLGLIHHYGQGTTKDLPRAFNYYLVLAEQNDIRAQFNIGLMYRYGLGTDKNLTEML